jgi:thiamine-phosphate diphosphorylase
VSTAPRLPRLHLVTDDEALALPGFLETAVRIMAAGGGDLALHLRAPGASGRGLHQMAANLAPAASRSGALLLINDRVDVARAVAAGGVQLPGCGMPPDAARRVLGPGPVIGASVHSRAQAVDAAGADFLLVGTIFDSGSHPGHPGAGTSLISDVVRIGLPVVAIGGITHARVPEVMAAGATGVAVLSAVWHAPDAATATRGLLECLKEMDR